MAPFGKVHAALHSGADRVKSGILWGHHKYRQGVGLAGKANELWDTGKKVANMFMPAMDRIVPQMAVGVQGAMNAVDQLRDQGIARHQDVLNRISENGDIMRAWREAKPLVQPYFS